MNDVVYLQCKLRNGTRIDTRWIPLKYAGVGKALEIKDESGAWVDGWVVEEVYGTKMSEEKLVEVRDAHKYHRKRTDI